MNPEDPAPPPATPPSEPSAADQDFRSPRPLDPRIRAAWMVGGLISALILGGILLVLELTERIEPRLAYSVPVAALLLLRALLYTPLRYRAWSYAVREVDVLLSHGVWWQTRRSIPRSRIQHVDIESGPIERALGLANLILFTAGTGDSDGRIPGLRQRTAEALREILLGGEAATAASAAPEPPAPGAAVHEPGGEATAPRDGPP